MEESRNTMPMNVSQNYINEIQRIYENEKEQLITKNYLLQKSMNTNAKSYENRISELENQLNEVTEKNGIDAKSLIDNHEAEVKRIVQEKDAQINYLYNQNLELEKANNELLSKLNEYSDLINQNKLLYSDKLTNCESTINSLNKDCEDIKDFYEKKLAFFTQNFSSEKNKIINSYEKTIEKLNDGYTDSKNRYLTTIAQRDAEIKDLINNNRADTEDLNQQLYELKKVNEELQNDIEGFKKKIEEQNKEIRDDKSTIETLKVDIKRYKRELSQKEELYKEFEGKFNESEKNNANLMRLTRGNFAKYNTKNIVKKK